MDDELREKIAIALLNTDDSKKDETYREHKLRQADSILSLPSLREALEKAEKWDAYQAELANEKTHTDRFISLMDAEEDELRRDAGLWRKVKEIAKRNWYDGYPCDGCPVENCCDSADSLCGQADALVQALSEGKEEG